MTGSIWHTGIRHVSIIYTLLQGLFRIQMLHQLIGTNASTSFKFNKP
jgi:hypothetical protein